MAGPTKHCKGQQSTYQTHDKGLLIDLLVLNIAKDDKGLGIIPKQRTTKDFKLRLGLRLSSSLRCLVHSFEVLCRSLLCFSSLRCLVGPVLRLIVFKPPYISMDGFL